VSDGGVNIEPNINTLVSIVKNAVMVAHKLGKENPLVAMLAAVEVVNPDMEETIAAAVISQMNKRGQIKGCTIDGPLALDNAISQYAAKKKGIKSAVAGVADILIVPNMAAGNIFGKALAYYANFKNGHIIVGTKMPVMIPSRADTSDVKFNSIALAIASKK
jgi:phosphate butyryltransferase